MITFLGDVFPKSPTIVRFDLPGIVVLNLEAPLTKHEIGYPAKINLRGDTDSFARTFNGMNVVATLANNHILDFHTVGVDDTLRALRGLGIPHCGVGSEEDSWLNPLLLRDSGFTIALLAYADPSCTPVYAGTDHPGAAPLSFDQVQNDIERARVAGAERIVVSVHWGDEQVHLPSPRCVELARSIIDTGVDLVVGHHSHCIQSYEIYRGKPIMYGLGNCIFPAHTSPSYFNTEGESTRVKETRPSRRNRRSLGISWEPADGKFTILSLYFDGHSLRRTRDRHRRHRLSYGNPVRYESKYARAYVWGKLLHTLETFVSRPKLPKPTHFSSVGRLIRTAPRS